MYDEEGKGWLSEAQASKYLADLLDVSKLDPARLAALSKAPRPHFSSDQEKQEFYADFLIALLHLMDPLVTGRFALAALLRPNESSWTQTLVDVNALGAMQRAFTRRLRASKRRTARSLSFTSPSLLPLALLLAVPLPLPLPRPLCLSPSPPPAPPLFGMSLSMRHCLTWVLAS